MVNEVRGSSRPVLLSVFIFTVVAAVVVVSSLSVRLPNVSRLEYVLVGLLYSALLSVFAVGLSLAPRRAQVGLALAFICVILAFGVWLATVYLINAESIELIVRPLIPIQLGLFGLLTVGGLFSLHGWIKFFRQRK